MNPRFTTKDENVIPKSCFGNLAVIDEDSRQNPAGMTLSRC
jgi:hypothetical protein